MSVTRQIVKRAMGTALPRHRLLFSGPSRPHSESERATADIALTFDDGPHPTWTPAVLDALAEAGWKGTFFVIGERVEQHPELVRRIIDEGHTLANHTYTHSSPDATSADAFLAEVTRTRDVIHHLTGVSTSYVRPPLGKLTWRKLCGLWTSRQPIVLWNTDPRDFAMRAESEAATWVQRYEPRAGDIVLLHDRLPYAAQIVRALSRRWKDAIRSVSVSDWIVSAAGDRSGPRDRWLMDPSPPAMAEASR